MGNNNKIYEIRDPIYGFIKINDWERQIINSTAFQRLRRIQQLALTSYIYPSATHTRFEHSLGVMHFATQMYDNIIFKDKNKEILKDKLSYYEDGLNRDRQLIRLAALLHDVGHSAFSHALEGVMPINPKTKEKYTHEDYSIKIIKDVLRSEIENHPINEINYNIKADEIAEFLYEDALREISAKTNKKTFWKQLITSQLDADRSDYLLRDSYHIGVKYGSYDHNRLLNTVTLGILDLPEEEEKLVIGVETGGWQVAESVIVARYYMFTQVYYHKTRCAYDIHLKKAINEVFGDAKYPSPDEIKKFLDLDDYHMLQSFRKGANKYENCKAIVSRDHMRSIYETPASLINKTGVLSDLNEDAILKKITKKLSLEGIPYVEDKPSNKPWYKYKGVNDINIIDNNQIRGLSNYSKIVREMGNLNLIRIYTSGRDRERGKEIVESILKKNNL